MQCYGMTHQGSRCKNQAVTAGHCRTHYKQNPTALKKLGSSLKKATKWTARKTYKGAKIGTAKGKVFAASQKVKLLTSCAKDLGLPKAQLGKLKSMKEAQADLKFAKEMEKEVKAKLKSYNPRRQNSTNGTYKTYIQLGSEADVEIEGKGKIMWEGSWSSLNRDFPLSRQKMALLKSIVEKDGKYDVEADIAGVFGSLPQKPKIHPHEMYYVLESLPSRATGKYRPRPRKIGWGFSTVKEAQKWVENFIDDHPSLIRVEPKPSSQHYQARIKQSGLDVDYKILKQRKSKHTYRNPSHLRMVGKTSKKQKRLPLSFESFLKDNNLIALPWIAKGYYVLYYNHPTDGLLEQDIVAVRRYWQTNARTPFWDTRAVYIGMQRDGKFIVKFTGNVRYGTQPETSNKVEMDKFFRYKQRTYKTFSRAMQKYVNELLGGKPTPIKALQNPRHLNPRRRSNPSYEFTSTHSNAAQRKKYVAAMKRKVKSIEKKIMDMGDYHKIAGEIDRLDFFAYDRYIDDMAVLKAKKDLQELNERLKKARFEAQQLRILSDYNKKRKAVHGGRGEYKPRRYINSLCSRPIHRSNPQAQKLKAIACFKNQKKVYASLKWFVEKSRLYDESDIGTKSYRFDGEVPYRMVEIFFDAKNIMFRDGRRGGAFNAKKGCTFVEKVGGGKMGWTLSYKTLRGKKVPVIFTLDDYSIPFDRHYGRSNPRRN